MKPTEANERRKLLVLNVGSSSLKFQVFDAGDSLRAVTSGNVARTGNDANWLGRALDNIGEAANFADFSGIGHRIVHGGLRLTAPQLVEADLIAELKRLVAFAPEHLPMEIALIEEIARRFPDLRQVACFDTAFHRELPRIAHLLAIPRRFEAAGLRRYGFHGLSYQFLCDELARLGDPAIARGRVILAHLGSGASLAAVRDGHCIDTSMGFTPAAGLVMGTRSGDLDPGVLAYLVRTDGMTPDRFSQLINHESGLLGVSETSGDIRDLLACEASDVRAAEAVALFCRQTKKWIGAFAAVLGGLDTLVFSAGIGEHSAPIRQRICAELEFLGLVLDDHRNNSNAAIISSAASRVTVRVIPTNEELVIARAVCRLLQLNPPPRP